MRVVIMEELCEVGEHSAMRADSGRGGDAASWIQPLSSRRDDVGTPRGRRQPWAARGNRATGGLRRRRNTGNTISSWDDVAGRNDDYWALIQPLDDEMGKAGSRIGRSARQRARSALAKVATGLD